VSHRQKVPGPDKTSVKLYFVRVIQAGA
jgi:hypothetical protein